MQPTQVSNYDIAFLFYLLCSSRFVQQFFVEFPRYLCPASRDTPSHKYTLMNTLTERDAAQSHEDLQRLAMFQLSIVIIFF